MRPRKTVEQWRRLVFRAPVTDATRVLLLLLADEMRADLTVCVPRSELARRLDRSERRIQERIKEAKERDLLATIVRGQKHVTAVYGATFPDALRGTESSTLRGPKSVTLRNGHPGQTGVSVGHTGVPPSKRAATGAAVGNVPDEGQRRGDGGRESAPIVRAAVDRLADESAEKRRTA